MIYHYWFLNHGFTSQDFVTNGCHDFKSFCLKSDIAIITVKNVDYNCIIDDISKSEVIDLLENVVLEDPRFI